MKWWVPCYALIFMVLFCTLEDVHAKKHIARTKITPQFHKPISHHTLTHDLEGKGDEETDSSKGEAEDEDEDESKKEGQISTGTLLKAAAFGGATGVAGGMLASFATGGEADMVQSAITGAAAASATNLLGQTERTQWGKDVSSGGMQAGMSIGVGSAIGGGTFLTGRASGSAEGDDVKERLASGILGAFVGHELALGKAVFKGDAQLSCEEIHKAFEDKEELTLSDIHKVVGISHGNTQQLMEKVGYSQKTKPKMISTNDLCLYLDEDESGFVDIDELTQKLFFGDESAARHFMVKHDTDDDSQSQNGDKRTPQKDWEEKHADRIKEEKDRLLEAKYQEWKARRAPKIHRGRVKFS